MMVAQQERSTDNATDLIFLSIASYRDPQLMPTVEDCLRKAAHPDRLRFGICWQHGENEALPARFAGDDRFRILDVPWRESQGACWARAAVMALWREEAWFLQVDSHCRFKAGWDEILVRTARALDVPKPILSTYAAPFVPGEPEVLAEAPLQMALQGFTPEGIPYMKPLAMPGSLEGMRPRRARFLSAGFLFAPGCFVPEVPYDPSLYFVGEEIAMTVRAFTSGYELFHPAETIVWHDYVRRSGIKHWEDHTEQNRVARAWAQHDLRSKARVARLLRGERLDGFNLGTVRSLGEYEAYAGISFRARKAQVYTMRAEEPPNPTENPGWEDEIFTWLVRIVLHAEAIDPRARADAALWYLGVHDDLGNEIYRRDLTPEEVSALPRGEPELVLVCELQSGSIPASWTVWPATHGGGWLPKLQGHLADEDFSVLAEEPDGLQSGCVL